MNKPICTIIHCSATPSNRDYSLLDIDRIHRQKGYACIGYHYYITKAGVIHPGRPISKVGVFLVLPFFLLPGLLLNLVFMLIRKSLIQSLPMLMMVLS